MVIQMNIHQSTGTNAVGAEFHRLMRIKDVSEKTGISRTKIYLLIQQGQFPPPLKMGSRIALWPESDVNGWITELVQKSKGVAA